MLSNLCLIAYFTEVGIAASSTSISLLVIVTEDKHKASFIGCENLSD